MLQESARRQFASRRTKNQLLFSWSFHCATWTQTHKRINHHVEMRLVAREAVEGVGLEERECVLVQCHSQTGSAKA